MVEEDKNMEFMKIGNNSLKITLSAKEAKGYDLTEDARLDGEEVKRTFEKLLMRAKREIGYKYAGERVIAEIFSSKNGGCEIFLSYAEDSMYKEIQSKDSLKKTQKPNFFIYAINNFEDLLNISYTLNQLEYKGKSTVYYDESNETYYIALEDASIKNEKFYFISEFARQVKNGQISYAREHFKSIMGKNAIKVLASLK
jgi:negative regulator of genetic competence, sporulation and motility